MHSKVHSKGWVVKKFLVVLVATMVSLGVMSPPAQAANTNVTVTSFPSSLTLFTGRCDTPGNVPTPTPLVISPGAIGGYGQGWDFAQSGNMAGPIAYWPNAENLNLIEFDLYSPNTATGYGFAIIYAAQGRYEGFTSQITNNGGWGPAWQINPASVNFTWTFYPANGGAASSGGTDTIVGRAVNGNPIRVGVMMGCNGNPYYIDNLILGGGGNTTTYNFERRGAMAHMEWSTDNKKVIEGSRLVTKYGQTFWMLGHSHGHSAAGAEWYDGLGTLWVKNYGSSQWVKAGAGEFYDIYYASFRRTATKRAQYFFSTTGSSVFHPSNSGIVTVEVNARVRSKVIDKKVRVGQKITVKGAITPGNKGVKLTLQRKVGKKWKKIGTAKTKGGGKFKISGKATKKGTWTVRVKVASGKGNLGTTTNSAKVKVTPKPNPPSDGAAPVNTAPETQVTYTAPTADDRSTPGRKDKATRAPAPEYASEPSTQVETVPCGTNCPSGLGVPKQV